MNIAYDIFLEYPAAIEIVRKDEELDTFFIELLKFVSERLKPLTNEIEEEETEAEKVGNWYATIILLMNDEGKFINFRGYSTQLGNKMLSCFGKNDINYILDKITKINQARNN